MRQRQITGGEQGKEAFSPLLQYVHLAKGGDAVDAGIGAGIGSQHQAFIEHNANAIGQAIPLLSLLLLLAWKHDRVGHGFNATAAAHAADGAGPGIVKANGGADVRFGHTGAV